MKTSLCAGMLSLLLSCTVYAQDVVNKGDYLKGARVAQQSSVAQSSVNQTSQTQVKIDLNKADAHELAHSIKGIGEKRAEAIIKYRQAHGSFKSVMELASVPGIGSGFVKKNNAELEQLFKVN